MVMGSFTVNRWRCDRCGIEKDKWHKPASAYSIAAGVDYSTAGGPLFQWKELCGACNVKMGAAIEAMQKAADAERAALSLAGGASTNSQQETAGT
jgi:hypothetical protein